MENITHLRELSHFFLFFSTIFEATSLCYLVWIVTSESNIILTLEAFGLRESQQTSIIVMFFLASLQALMIKLSSAIEKRKLVLFFYITIDGIIIGAVAKDKCVA